MSRREKERSSLCSPGPIFPVFPKRILCSPVAIHTGEHRTLFGKSGEHRTLFPAIYQSLKIFKLWRGIRVKTANRRSTAWPLSDMCNVTANQRSTGQLSAVQSGVNCSMEGKVNVAVCDSRSSIHNIIVYNIIFVCIISRPKALCASVWP